MKYRFKGVKGYMEYVNGYARLDGETDEQLIYRVCNDKQIIGTWQDVADILNKLLNKEYTESAYRKMYQSFNKTFFANKNKIFNNDEYLSKVNDTEQKIRKERIKLQTANIERNRLDRAEARREMYYEYISDVVSKLNIPDFEPLIDTRLNENEYIICISDLHYGATFKSVNNEYSPQICKERLEILLGDLIQFIDEKRIQHVRIVNLGDTIQGLLRLSDLKANDSSVVKAVVEASQMIAKFLNALSKYTMIDYYHVPTANHTQIRVLGAKASELADEDFEYIIAHYINDLLSANNRITVHIADDGSDYIDIDLYDYNVIATHGHQIRNMNSAIKDVSMLKSEIIDFLFMGHFHSSTSSIGSEHMCNDTEVLVCPSFIGSDPYSDLLLKGSKAAVKIYGFDEIFGHTETYKIVLN